MAPSSAASFGFIEVAGVAVNLEHHVAGREFEDGFGQGGKVIEKLVDSNFGGFGCFALLRGKRTEGNKGCTVNSSGVVQKFTNNLLDALLVSIIEVWGCVAGVRELYFGAILGCIVFVWQKLGA